MKYINRIHEEVINILKRKPWVVGLVISDWIIGKADPDKGLFNQMLTFFQCRTHIVHQCRKQIESGRSYHQTFSTLGLLKRFGDGICRHPTSFPYIQDSLLHCKQNAGTCTLHGVRTVVRKKVYSKLSLENPLKTYSNI